MFKSILLPLAIGTSVALGGAAYADSVTKNPQLYKLSRTKQPAMPKEGSVKPRAQESKNLYKDSQGSVTQTPDRAVNPDAPIDTKRYKESTSTPTNNENYAK